MTADELYECMKDALRYLDMGWGEKDKVVVWLDGTCLVFSSVHKECRISLPFRSAA